MAAVFEITSHEIIKEDYFRLMVQSDNRPCGFVDFIADKVNFNISCKNDFFKGMESIVNITFKYEKDRLFVVFKNKRPMVFTCKVKILEQISHHIKGHGNSGKSQNIKNSFFND